MRNIRVVFAVLSLSVVLVAGVADELQAQEKRQGWTKRLRYRRELRRELQGEIQLSGAFALYPMAVKWAEEFRKIHPKVRIDISAGGNGLPGYLSAGTGKRGFPDSGGEGCRRTYY